MVSDVILPMHTRTIRVEAIQSLLALGERLESYKPVPEAEETSELKERIAELEEQLLISEDSAGSATTPDTGDKTSVFVIMPFKADLNDVWQGGIKRAATAAGFRPIRVDTINRSSNITEDIVESIDKCHLAIVDVTGNNPNVMFELGYALAKDKPCIIISQSADYLPFDIRNLRTIVYTNSWSGIETLNATLGDYLKETSGTRSKNAVKTRISKKSANRKTYPATTGTAEAA